jgi:hypothetical protein
MDQPPSSGDTDDFSRSCSSAFFTPKKPFREKMFSPLTYFLPQPTIFVPFFLFFRVQFTAARF